MIKQNGGRRPGAGRKLRKGPTKVRSVRVMAPVADWLEAEAKRRGCSQGDIVDQMIVPLMGHPEKP